MKTFNHNKIFVLILTLFSISCITQTDFNYRIDLNKATNNEIVVELECPKIDEDTMLFQFVKMDPGHWANETNFGLYVDDFKAFDKNSKLLVSERNDTNSFKIYNSKDLKFISYRVHDTWSDTIHKSNKFAFCAGTSFQDDQFYLLNGGVYGFLKGYKNFSYRTKVIKKNEQKIIKGSKEYISTNNYSIFNAKNFAELYDKPIVVGDLDTCSFTINGTKFNIVVFNEQGIELAREFADIIKPQIKAVYAFFYYDLPLKEYSFFFYIKDFNSLTKYLKNASSFNDDVIIESLKINSEFNGYSASALEHKTSSFFTLIAEENNQTDFNMLNYIIHEFIHIYSPKELATENIKNFNYANPELSGHRWLYEGVIEYFSGLIKVQNNLICKDEFLQEFIRPKLILSSYYPNNITFYEQSKNAYKDPYKMHYFQFYSHGPIIAMLLDIEIIKLTKGMLSLKEVFCQLYEESKFRKFEEDELFDEFVTIVHPELEIFFNQYVRGTEKLPVKELLAEIGVSYYPEIEKNIPDINLDVVPLFNYYFINSSNITGLNYGDKVDIVKVGRNCQKPYLLTNGEFVEENSLIQFPVIRGGKELFISTPVKLKKGIYKHQLYYNTKLTDKQTKYFNKWIGK